MLNSTTTLDGTPIKGLKPNSEKRVSLTCDGCGNPSTTTYHNYRLGLLRNGQKRKTWCRRCGCKKAGAARRGTPSPFRGVVRPNQRGARNVRWNGGRYTDVHGYVMVKTTDGRPHSHNGWRGYHKEHIIVAEKMLGRLLEQGEIVHHIDGKRDNNETSNLWVSTHAGHRNAHQTLQEIGYLLIRKQLLQFDRKNGQYVVAHEKLRELLEQP